MTAPKSSPPSRRYSRAAACGGRRAPSSAPPSPPCRCCAVSACPSPWPMRWPMSKRPPRSSPRRRAGRGRCERSPKRFSRREETGRAWSRNTWSNAAMSQSGRLDPVERGRRVLALEAEAIQALAGRLGSAFAHAVTLLSQAKGRVIVSGVGKSGLIARKIAATFTSTGTPAAFLHPVDSLHGDLGIVGKEDVAVLLSKSGSTDELFDPGEQLKRLRGALIARAGAPRSGAPPPGGVAVGGAV